MQFLDLAPIHSDVAQHVAFERYGCAAGTHEVTGQLVAIGKDDRIRSGCRGLSEPLGSAGKQETGENAEKKSHPPTLASARRATREEICGFLIRRAGLSALVEILNQAQVFLQHR